jgi:hypothetical protein
MKTICFILFSCLNLAGYAQVKPSQKTNDATIKEKPPKKSTIKAKQSPLADSAIKPMDGHNHGDTIKIDIPKDNSFNPSNSKLKKSKVKTPVYNNQVTGTNAPGDVNTGLPPDNTTNPAPPKNISKDSTKSSARPE